MILLEDDSREEDGDGGAEFGVVRRRTAKKGGADLLAALIERRTVCLRKLGRTRAGEVRFGRLLRNAAVTAAEMIAEQARAVGERAAGRHVLAIQDTTEINLNAHRASKRGFGTAGNGCDIGLFLHPVIALEAGHGGILGLVDAQVINRTRGKVLDRKKRPLARKESWRWIAGQRRAREVLREARSVTVVADRESDIYAAFAARAEGLHLIIRAAQDRALDDGGRLFATVAGWTAEKDRLTVKVPVKPGQSGREACLALRFGAVTLRRPKGESHSLPEEIALWAVDVREEHPPHGATPVHWLLLTSHRLASPEDARRIIAWYRMRWTIEQVFRTLKSNGFDVEDSQVIAAESFIKLLIAALIAALFTMQLVHARHGATGQRLADAMTRFDCHFLAALTRRLEGKTDKQKNPHPPDSLAYLAWIAGRLGGWSGYTSKGYKPPGPKTMHDGLIQLEARHQGWIIAKDV